MPAIIRLSRLFNRGDRRGLFDVGRTKGEDYLLRDPEAQGADRLIPNTNVERMRLMFLGDRAVAVTTAEVDRVIRQLEHWYTIAAAAQRSKRRVAAQHNTKHGTKAIAAEAR